MLITKIKCLGCRSEGEIEIFGVRPGVARDRLFEYLGHNEFTGDMYFRCPHCEGEVLVNPMETLGPGTIKGIPRYREAALSQFGGGGFESVFAVSKGTN